MKQDAKTPRTPRRRTISSSYSLAAGAAVAATGGAAEAQVVYGGLIDESIDQLSRLELVVVNDGLEGENPFPTIPTDPNADLILENYVFLGGNYQGAAAPIAPGGLVATRPIVIAYGNALSSGFLVDANSVDSAITDVSLAYGFNPSSEFDSVEDAFIGFSFSIFPEGAETPNEHYGWARVTIENAAGVFVLHDFAYESQPGVGILAGDTGASGLGGDFNNDQVVDAADYTVWRDLEGFEVTSETGVGDPLSGNGDDSGDSAGLVDDADLALWRANYGQSVSATAVPEPVSLGLLAAGAAGVAVLRRGARRQENGG